MRAFAQGKLLGSGIMPAIDLLFDFLVLRELYIGATNCTVRPLVHVRSSRAPARVPLRGGAGGCFVLFRH